MSINIRHLVIFILSLSFSLSNQTNNPDYEKYCLEMGGEISPKVAGYDTATGYSFGNSLNFCQINDQGNLGMIGIETLASTLPSIVSTYVKKLVLSPTKSIKGPYVQPATNLCYKLGGSSILFNLNGGFYDELGYAGICFFGDGSHIAEWTLLYAGMGLRDDIKNGIKGEVLNIDIPNVYE